MARKTVYLIRHGKTAGNIERRYIGARTDEPLCEEGIGDAEKLRDEIPDSFYAKTDKVFSGPMLRARQTAHILFEGHDIGIIDELTETDFGYFEGKNYSELNGDPLYQKWIDGGGADPIPGAEKREDLIARSYDGLIKALGDLTKDECISIVCHGGNIMALLSYLTGRNYFDFMTDNLECWVMDLETYDKRIASITYDRFYLRNGT